MCQRKIRLGFLVSLQDFCDKLNNDPGEKCDPGGLLAVFVMEGCKVFLGVENLPHRYFF